MPEEVFKIRKEIQRYAVMSKAITFIIVFIAAFLSIGVVVRAQGPEIGMASKVVKDVIDRGDVVFGLVVLCILLVYALYRLIDRMFKANEKMTSAISSSAASSIMMSKSIDRMSRAVEGCGAGPVGGHRNEREGGGENEEKQRQGQG